MENAAARFISNSLSPSSRRAYSSAQAHFLRFCQRIRQPPMPASEQVLVLFTAYLAQTCSYGTCRAYLSAVRHWHVSRGCPDPLVNTQQLTLTLRGIRRFKPSTPDSRLPITPLILETILRVVQQNSTDYTNILMWAACCLGYFAFMRSGEFTVNEQFDHSRHLTVRDVAVDSYDSPSMLSIHLRTSKTKREWVWSCMWAEPSNRCAQ